MIHCSEHVSSCQPALVGGDEERGAKLLTESDRQRLGLLSVIAVALEQHARAIRYQKYVQSNNIDRFP